MLSILSFAALADTSDANAGTLKHIVRDKQVTIVKSFLQIFFIFNTPFKMKTYLIKIFVITVKVVCYR